MGRDAATRGHEILAHTADAGLRTWAPDLPALFEEAAAALAELAADVDAGGLADTVPVELTAPDLVGLAYAWLNELIGLADARAAAIARARVESVRLGPLPAAAHGHRQDRSDEQPAELRATIDLVSRGPRARPRVDVKSATYHRLAVEPLPDGGWTLTAYLDV